MEGILAIILIYGGYLLIASMVSSGAKAVKKAVTGRETYFGPPELKLIDEEVEGGVIAFKKIMFRGRLPAPRSMKMAYSISAFDATNGDEKLAVVISLLDGFREKGTMCFGLTNEIGFVNPGDCLTDWARLGAIAPNFIQGPKSGLRRIKVLVRLFDADNPPTIRGGFVDDGESIFADYVEFTHEFQEKGYEEEAQDREEAQSLSLKIGIAVAMADGKLDDLEGEVLKNWVIREISSLSESKSARLKQFFNDTLQEGFKQAQSNELSLSPIVERLAKIGDRKSKYDAIELALDVMAADGVADSEEMILIRNVAKSLDLDMDELERMRERVTLNLSIDLASDGGLESLVGIEGSWTDDQKKKHLRLEFQKWSNRLNSLPDGEERDAAQKMLDSIASLRKKYG